MNVKNYQNFNNAKHYGKIRFKYLPLFIVVITITCLTTVGIAQEKAVTIDKTEQNEVMTKI